MKNLLCEYECKIVSKDNKLKINNLGGEHLQMFIEYGGDGGCLDIFLDRYQVKKLIKTLSTIEKGMSSGKKIDIYQLASLFSMSAHSSIGQMRKYTEEPYYYHTFRVANTVYEHGGSEDMVVAAYLHDVVEDTSISINDISGVFGNDVAELVLGLTNKSSKEDGGRIERKRIDREYLKEQSNEVKTIKLADILDNLSTFEVMYEHDKQFANKYLIEKELMLEVLKGGNEDLWNKLDNRIKELKCF